MSDKEVLVQNLREWMGLETEINTLRNKMKEIRTRKKEITENLVNFMKSKDIDCFDTNDGKIILRNVAKKNIPDNISTLVKKGFTGSDSLWFRNQSKKFIFGKIQNKKNLIYNFMDYKEINKMVESHINNKENKRLFIWSILYFEEFLNQNKF